ncbi:MAG: cobalt chelatase [Pseudomonadota bacterium]
MSEQIRRRRLERHCAAAMRSISGRRDVEYRQQRLYVEGKPLNLFTPHLVADAAADSFARVRGVTDSMALRLRHSDSALHGSLMPDDDVGKIVFDTLEQLRVESLVDDMHAGSRRNMQLGFDDWCQRCRADGVTESELGLLIYSITQIARSRLVNAVQDEAVEGLIESVRFRLAPVIGDDLLGLRKHRGDQRRFAEYALNIAHTVSEIARANMNLDADEDSDIGKIKLPMPPIEESDDRYVEAGEAGRGGVDEMGEAGFGYRVFTREFDRETSALDMYRLEQLENLRRKIDALIKAQAISIPRLAQRLQRLFSVPHLSGWDFGEDEGHIDGRRLSQLVSNPANHRLFKQEKNSPKSDTVISFLIDNSGSMKRQRFETVTVLVDIYARALELAGVKTEILGFSTSGWSGGKSILRWRQSGSPEKPGRMNDRLHIVYKDADTRWRRSRMGVAAMMNTTHYREGLDGEAVTWACQRLSVRNESRKCLVMFSDGAPMDSATSQCNDEMYLQHHLKRVVSQIERQGQIEIRAIGIDLDMEAFFSQTISLDLYGTLGNRAFRALDMLFGRYAGQGRQLSA